MGFCSSSFDHALPKADRARKGEEEDKGKFIERGRKVGACVSCSEMRKER